MDNFIYAIFVFSCISMVFIGFVLVKLLLNNEKDNEISRLNDIISNLEKRNFYLNEFISSMYKPCEVSIKEMEDILDSKIDS